MIIKDVLERAIETNRERHAVYQDGWKVQAEILRILYPNGIPTVTPRDAERATFVFMIAAKLVRYALATPHLDSVHDLGVYAFMLEQLDTLSYQGETDDRERQAPEGEEATASARSAEDQDKVMELFKWDARASLESYSPGHPDF